MKSISERRATSDKGFTLVEVLIAIAILASGLVLVVEGMARSQQSIRIAENLVSASQIAGEKITEYQLDVRQFHTLRGGGDTGKIKKPGRSFEWDKSVTSYADDFIDDETKINRASVSVKWNEGRRVNDLQLETLIVNREKKE